VEETLVKRSGPPKRRTRLKARSSSGEEYEEEYRQASILVENRARGRCEIRSTHDCDGISTGYPHHRKLRSQGGSNALDNLLAVCFTGHQWIHQVLPRAEAERLQLIVPRETPEYPYDPEGRVT
jgi:hypothetical protein